MQNFQLFQKKAETGTTDSAGGTSTRTVERDVEAPDVFSVTARGLWDGRPSLGGVWVAHDEVTDPERVLIKNTENGQFVVGALFKRESTTPGPAIQVSSDAASTLGMIAGDPAMLSVVALRREEVAVPDPAAEALAPSDTIETAPLDPVAEVSAALDALEGDGQPAAAKVAPAPAPAPKPAPTSSLDKPYIQIGIFSVEENAQRTVRMLGGDGVIASVKPFESNGKSFWRVVVGPANTSAERASLLEKVKGVGFTDAYFVTH